MLMATSVFAGGTINNYLDGFSYKNDASGSIERIVAVKNLASTDTNTYSVLLELVEASGNEFTALVNDQKISPDVSKQGVIEMLSATLHGRGDDSALRIDYELTKNELLALYGEDSLLIEAMLRCDLESVKLKIEIEGDEFRFISPLYSQTLTRDTIHHLAFCD